MATIPVVKFGEEGAIVPVTLTGTDDATVSLQTGASLIFTNTTGGQLDLVITSDATSTVCPGVGSIDLSGGAQFAIPDATTALIPLNPNYQKWLGNGVLTIAGGTGGVAYIIAQ